MVRKIFILLFLITNFTLNAQEINLKVSTDSTIYEIGDYINISYLITHSKDITIFFPSLKDSIKNLEYIESFPVQSKEDGNKKESIYKFIFAGFDSGSVTIPSVTIEYKSISDSILHRVTTDSVILLIKTLPVDVSADIMDIKAPMTIDIDWVTLLLIAAIIIAVLILGYFSYKKYFAPRWKKESIEEEIYKLPYEEALDSLRDLDEKKLWQSGKIKEYHSEITSIVRRYFERRFEILALEMPTSEILDKLNGVTDAKIIIEITEKFLLNADMVKFAKFLPLNDVNIEMMNQAYSIVDMTKEESSIGSLTEGDSNVQ
jgi:hypothetical protein